MAMFDQNPAAKAISALMAAPGGFLESRSAAACRQQPGKGPGPPSDPLKREAC